MKSIVTFLSFVPKVTCFVCKDTYFFDIKIERETKIFNLGLSLFVCIVYLLCLWSLSLCCWSSLSFLCAATTGSLLGLLRSSKCCLIEVNKLDKCHL